jgi:hypothetical protein
MMAGHDGKVLDVAFLAGMLAGLFYILDGKRWFGAGLFSVFTALFISMGHYQVIYYGLILFLFAGGFTIYHAIKTLPGLLKDIAILTIAGGLALLPNLRSLIGMNDYTKETMRGGKSAVTIGQQEKKSNGGLDKDYAFSWSNGIGETFAMMIPGLYGPAADGGELYINGKTASTLQEMGMSPEIAGQLPEYWGPQPFLSGPAYIGAVIMSLAILGMFVIKSPHKYWIGAATLLFILLSLGKNFSALNYFLFDHLPMYNKFRAPTMALVIPTITCTLLALWCVSDLIKGERTTDELMRFLKIGGGISLGVIILFGLGNSFTLDFQGAQDAQVMEQLGKEKGQQLVNAMISDRSSYAFKDAIKSLVYVLLALGAIWMYLKKSLSKNVLAIGLGALAFVELFILARKYVPEQRFLDKDQYQSNYFSARPIDLEIMKDPDPSYRVQDFSVNTYNDAKGGTFHKMIGGYSPVKLEIIQDLIDIHISKNNKEVYNMLNCKYFIVGKPGAEQIIPNPTRCGNAWFVKNVKSVSTANDEMLAMNAPSLSDTAMKGDFIAKDMAIMQDSMSKYLSAKTFTVDSSAKITLTQYDPNECIYESNNNAPGLAVFSEIFYKSGITPTIDGNPVKLLRTNYLLRAIQVPAGKHTIKFIIEPTGKQMWKTISLASSIAAIGLLIFGIFQYIKKEHQEDDNTPSLSSTQIKQ